jgi:hypothetical protein
MTDAWLFISLICFGAWAGLRIGKALYLKPAQNEQCIEGDEHAERAIYQNQTKGFSDERRN